MKASMHRTIGRSALVLVVSLLGGAGLPEFGGLLGTARADAATIYVSTAGNDVNNGLSWPTAKRTVQAGLSRAAAGDQVWVAAGTYVEWIILRWQVALYGGFAGTEADLTQRDWKANETILDGNQSGSVVRAPSGATASTRIDGFTITNGSGTQSGYDTYGGGLFLDSASPTIANNTITNNWAAYGGGIVADSSPTIVNNTIAGSNAAREGGGLYLWGSSPAIANTIIAFNSSGIYRYGGSLTLRYNCIYGNAAYNFSGLSDPTGTDGNISADPRLASVSYANSHIQAHSPCVDAGDDSVVQAGWTDVDGQPRIVGDHVDIGTDESDGTVWSSGPNVIVRVSPTGEDANDGSSWMSAKRTVQAGIDAVALAGGEVWVAAGTYRERVTLHPYAHVYGGFAGSETLRDQRNWAANRTILDGQQLGSVVTARTGGYRLSTIDGFTITNGSGTESASYTYGGALYLYHSSPTITNNTITGNSAFYGGGLYLWGSSPMITNNTITGNNASYGGSGLYLYFSSPTIANNTITSNDALWGGGLFVFGSSSPTIANTIIALNSSGVYRASATATPTLRCNCVYGNTAYNFSGLTDPTGSDGNISEDPRFVRPASPGADGTWGTADDDYGDLRLLPGSPCIDAGSNADVPADAADLDGDGDGDVAEPLPLDLAGGKRFLDVPASPNTGAGTPPIVDMGAYEAHRPGDVDGDGDVDVFDIIHVVNAFGCVPGYPNWIPAADFDGNGIVDVFDVIAAVTNFGAGT